MQVQKALEIYYKDRGVYPKSSGLRGGICDGSSFLIKDYVVAKDAVAPIPWGDEWRNYMKQLPKDPDGKKCYVYHATPDGQAYWLYASLDREGKDKAACNNGYACNNLTANDMQNTQCGGICNYGVTSANVSP